MSNEQEENVYHIKTVEDFKQIPRDKIDACLKDFSNYLKLCNFIEGLGKYADVKNGHFKWIDDGEHDAYVNVNVTNKEQDE